MKHQLYPKSTKIYAFVQRTYICPTHLRHYLERDSCYCLNSTRMPKRRALGLYTSLSLYPHKVSANYSTCASLIKPTRCPTATAIPLSQSKIKIMLQKIGCKEVKLLRFAEFTDVSMFEFTGECTMISLVYNFGCSE